MSSPESGEGRKAACAMSVRDIFGFQQARDRPGVSDKDGRTDAFEYRVISVKKFKKCGRSPKSREFLYVRMASL